MTFATSSTRIRHDSDALFREWVLEMTTKMAACGMVQHTDTGQIDPATVVRAGANADAGFQIWRFNDALQATAPIFMRINYGTSSSASAPRLQVQFGTSTNGTGTLGGVTTTLSQTSSFNQVMTTDDLRNSYWTHSPGIFAMNWKQGAGNTESFIIVGRIMDANGAPTADGALPMVFGINVLRTSCMKFGSGSGNLNETNSIATASICHWPFSRASSVVGADPQASIPFGMFPKAYPIYGFLGVLNAEFPTGNTFLATPLGPTSHTYMALSNASPFLNSQNTLKPAVVWE